MRKCVKHLITLVHFQLGTHSGFYYVEEIEILNISKSLLRVFMINDLWNSLKSLTLKKSGHVEQQIKKMKI